MIDVVINVLTAVINILPMSPIALFIAKAGELDGLAMLNWFIPFDIFLVILEQWVVCMGIYYLFRHLKSNLQK